MKKTQHLMGMHVTVEIVDDSASEKDMQLVFDYLASVDERFSTYKPTSEITKINQGKLNLHNLSKEMQVVFQLAEQTQKETNGYFNISQNGVYDPSGLVKGWAIYQTSLLLKKKGLRNFFIDVGGDVQVSGRNKKGKFWTVGIQSPFNTDETIKSLAIFDKGVATSGTYVRGQHIYNPHQKNTALTDIVSLTVIGPNVYEADRFVTAAFAMGRKGIFFIENLSGFEGYMIDRDGIATYTSGFTAFVST